MVTTGTRRADKKLDKRRRISEAAWALFREHGFEGTTTRAIAERAGIATGTLFLYVRDKDEALALVFQDDVRGMLDHRLATLPPRARLAGRLRHLFRGFFELYGRHPSLARRFVQRIPALEAVLHTSHEGLNEAIRNVIAAELDRAARRGELRADADRRVATANLFAVFRIRVFEWLAAPPCLVERGVSELDSAVGQIIEGIGAKVRG